MKTLLIISALTLVASPALAGPSCSGDAPMLPMTQIAKGFEDQGGRIKLIKETKGGCYEIYGYENDRKVEIYYDPRTGEVLEKEYD